MKIGLGLYRHMLSRDNYNFARQAGYTHTVIHLVDHFRQNSTNQPTAGKYGAWGFSIAGVCGRVSGPWGRGVVALSVGHGLNTAA
jgi:hypothetical protein